MKKIIETIQELKAQHKALEPALMGLTDEELTEGQRDKIEAQADDIRQRLLVAYDVFFCYTLAIEKHKAKKIF
ncbi:MAG: hypothetical protein KAR20_20295 [Candidatus Heimdallarchaeota archaeon]|nr:hypothetical protein [Candidatus Heimdallarchaeota archaeon]